MGKREEAKRLARHYFSTIAKSAGIVWDSDNDAEIEAFIDMLIDAGKEEMQQATEDKIGMDDPISSGKSYWKFQETHVRTIPADATQNENVQIVHKVWSILDKNLYVDTGMRIREQIYDLLSAVENTMGKSTMQKLVEYLDYYRQDTMSIMQKLAEDVPANGKMDVF